MQFTHEAQVAVDAPPQEVFEHWADAQFLPRVLSHVRATAVDDADDLARLVIVLEGRHFEFAVQRTMCGDNTICWQSLGDDFYYILTIALKAHADNETSITVHIAYDPPGFLIDVIECLGVSRFFKQALETDMARYADGFHPLFPVTMPPRDLAIVD